MAANNAALREAAKSGDAARVDALLAEGADINYQDKFGYTPLMLASMFGHTAIVRQLLKKGADRTLKSTEGETAADVAKGAVLGAEIRNYKPS